MDYDFLKEVPTMTPPDPRLECERLLVEAGRHAADMRFSDAETCYRQVVALDPMRAEAYFGLAQLAVMAANGEQCERFSEMALTINRHNHAYHFVYGMAQGMLGNLDHAMAAYRRALRLNPGAIQPMMNLIFTADLHPSTTPEYALALRREFDERFCKPYMNSAREAIGPFKNRPDPNRRIRIGYVSGDFRAHSAAAAFWPIIDGHDSEQFEVYLYSTHNPPDGADQREQFMKVANWRDLENASPGEQAQEIADDKIDMLVDLSGFTAGSALQAFALKPAPIQISAWGYISGTGMTAMDYLFADAVTVPESHEPWYAERVIRMPAIFPYAHDTAPEIRTPAPFERNGHMTYGYLGRGTKISAATLDAWAMVLRADETARMMLKSDSYRQKEMQRLVINGLLARGVDDSRVTVLLGTSREEHLLAHNDVDVILDTIPQTGGISTCDALLMGVPVVTLLGQRIPERVSGAILTSLGLTALVCETVDEYAQTALSLRPTAEDRNAIRQKLGQSPLLDHDGYCRAVETAYRTLFRGWCAEQTKQRESEAAA